MQDDAKFLKKNIRTCGIDVHPTEKALVVKYELEATILGELGDPMVGERKECQKIIRLKDLNDVTDIALLAKEVVERCKLIPISKLPEVEQLLFYLQNRRETPGSAKQKSDRSSTAPNADFDEIGSDLEERASVNRLEEYIEMLYEEIGEKIRGTALVLQLARNPDNLEELLQNETLLGALARVLREDWKKNLDLATNITYTFFCFSTFSQFHSMISHFKVGALCMQVVEYELKRYELWKEDLQQKSIHSSTSQSLEKEQDKNKRKFQALVKKQGQLLRVSLYLLLNLSEDVRTELKMVNRGIVEMLCKVLDRKDNQELMVLDLTFLKKLSIFVENKNRMAKNNVIERLTKVLAIANTDVTKICVKLLYNLSFDTDLRTKMVACGLLNHLVPLIADEQHEQLALSLLYHLSMDDDCKAMITYTDCISLGMRLLLEQDKAPVELKALLINLALNKRNAQLIAGDDGQGLKLLVQKAYALRDPLILKLLRNIASHDGPTLPMFVEYVKDLTDTGRRQCDSSGRAFEFGLECLDILGCLNLPELDWAMLVQECQLVPWFQEKLQPGVAEDDLLLVVIVFLGTVASDAGGAQTLLQHGLIDPLIKLLSAKQEDDEIVLQIIYVFYQMMFHDGPRNKLLSDTQVPAYLIDLMHDKNSEIRKMCDSTLEVIAEHGHEWAKKIQEEKFRWHNAQWLEMVGGQEGAIDPGGQRFALDDDDSDLDPMERSDVFSELYGLQAEDILENYESDRPLSRLDHRYINGLTDNEVDDD